MNKIYVGVDPGVKGFICISENGNRIYYEMPKQKKDKGKLDTVELVKLCMRLAGEYKKNEIIVGFEDVHALFGSSAKATFTFGHTVGQQYLALNILLLMNEKSKIVLITPKKWQALMWRGYELVKIPSTTGKTMVTDTKQTSENVARDLWPEEDWRRNTRCKVADDNKVDAALICEFLTKKY